VISSTKALGNNPTMAAQSGSETNAEIEIRNLQPSDCPQLDPLWKTVGLVPDDWDVEGELQAVMARNADLCFVAVIGTNVVGCVLGIDVGWGGLASRLAVACEYQRRRVASQLVDRLESRFHEIGKQGCAVILRADNEVARNFWSGREFDDMPSLLSAWHPWGATREQAENA
jgi:ribosomal protein S18 acetylase RimI-like enzyme